MSKDRHIVLLSNTSTRSEINHQTPRMSCKAVRFYAAKDVRVDEIAIPKVKPGWVVLKPEYCGICGSDLHEYLDGPHLIPAKGKPHVITGESVPIPLGHEFSGVIYEVGEGVTDLKPGDRCAVIPTIYDGDCRNCLNGLPNCCDKFGFIGLSGWGGGMSEYTTAPAEYIQKLPDDFPLDIGALVEPLSVGWHAVERSPYKKGDNVLVLGSGPIGLSVVLALLGQGCTNIIVSESSKRRRQFAIDFGAHHVIDPLAVDVVEEVKNLTKGQGADVAFDAAGVQVAVYGAIKAIRAKGTLVNIALWGDKEVSLNMVDMLFGEKQYMASKSLHTSMLPWLMLTLPTVITYTKRDFQAVIEAIASGKMKPAGMITKVLEMADVDLGFKALTDDKENQVKILIHTGKGTKSQVPL